MSAKTWTTFLHLCTLTSQLRRKPHLLKALGCIDQSLADQQTVGHRASPGEPALKTKLTAILLN